MPPTDELSATLPDVAVTEILPGPGAVLECPKREIVAALSFRTTLAALTFMSVVAFEMPPLAPMPAIALVALPAFKVRFPLVLVKLIVPVRLDVVPNSPMSAAELVEVPPWMMVLPATFTVNVWPPTLPPRDAKLSCAPPPPVSVRPPAPTVTCCEPPPFEKMPPPLAPPRLPPLIWIVFASIVCRAAPLLTMPAHAPAPNATLHVEPVPAAVPPLRAMEPRALTLCGPLVLVMNEPMPATVPPNTEIEPASPGSPAVSTWLGPEMNEVFAEVAEPTTMPLADEAPCTVMVCADEEPMLAGAALAPDGAITANAEPLLMVICCWPPAAFEMVALFVALPVPPSTVRAPPFTVIVCPAVPLVCEI